MLRTSKRAVALAAAVVMGSAVLAVPATAADTKTITIMADKEWTPVLAALLEGNAKALPGYDFKIQKVDFADIQSTFEKATAETAPDIIWGAQDWVAKYAASGLIAPITLSSATRKQFSADALGAFSYGGKNYGIPMTVDGVGMFVNPALVKKMPKTLAEAEQLWLKTLKPKGGKVGLCIQNDGGGDAWHHFGLLSALGGYVFGQTKTGDPNPKDLGLASPAFLKNASLIDRWNKNGFLSGTVTKDVCQSMFNKGETAMWVTGSWSVDSTKVKFTINPLLGLKANQPGRQFVNYGGVMLTKYAAARGVDSGARTLLSNFFGNSTSQFIITDRAGRNPANLEAAKLITNPVLKQFSAVGKFGYTQPSIPEMGAWWGPTGTAWTQALGGSKAIPAARAFKAAQEQMAKDLAK